MYKFAILLLISLVASKPIDDNSIDDGEDMSEIDLSGFDLSLFGSPDPETGEAVANWEPSENSPNPEELGSYLEGDMLIPKTATRNGIVQTSARWPNGVLPFIIRGDFSPQELNTIEYGMREYHAKTCIRFKRRTNERDYIAITAENTGCWSNIGRVGGEQQVNVQSPGCLIKNGTFLHEVMHALGFMHEQNRHERDDYITVQWNNIQPSTRTNFDKASSTATTAFGVPYDYGSVMHYSSYAFSINGQATIIPKQSVKSSILGQRDGFSSRDLQKLNAMYKCKSGSTTSTGSGHSPNSKPAKPSSQSYQPSYNTGVLGILGNLANAFGWDENNNEIDADDSAAAVSES